MSQFRSAVQGTAAAEIVTDTERIAFAREGRGFFALSGDNRTWRRIFQTTLPAGQYCDQYSGSLQDGKCTGDTITVNNDGSALLAIKSMSAVAFSFASRIAKTDNNKQMIRNATYSPLFVELIVCVAECSPGPHQQPFDECAIPIRHSTTVPFIFSEYISWSQRDDYLDFEGDEEKQGTHDGQVASGTPLAYSTNDTDAIEYQPHNNYGPDYWMVELLMDCAKTEQGWFELKGYHSPNIGWESNISQRPCSGSIGGSAPFSSINHIAKCGTVNVFSWGSNDCIVNSN
uniref:Aamy_C domain-containing protein n=1 Tax=Heterorhabditis bacteriophora TaxID=37862 RepID=A0A1I7XI80_HETBA